MHYSFTPEQEQFRDVVRRFLADQSPITRVRQTMATTDGIDTVLWRRLNDDLGLAGIHVPEALGGSGFGNQELGIVCEELGRALACLPYLSSAVLASRALRHGATPDEQATLLPRLVSGAATATLAWMEGPHWSGCGDIALCARTDGDAWRLDGRKTHVLDGVTADCVVVVARDEGRDDDGGIGLYLVDGAASGLHRRALASIDATRPLAELEFAGVTAQRLGRAGSGAAALARTLDDGAVALAHELVGAAQAVLEASVEYARLRMQFGRPIGSFQAIKHKCANLLLELELAKAAVYYAAAARDAGDIDSAALASQAKAQASEAALACAREAIQIHGGIGFTWDQDTHLWFKRVTCAAVLLGDAAWHRERFLALTERAA